MGRNTYIHSGNNHHFLDKEYFRLFSQLPIYFLLFEKNCIYLGEQHDLIYIHLVK